MSQPVMLLWQPGVIACNATPVRDTQGDALVTSETGGRWPRPVCHPRGLGSLPGRVPASLLHPPRAPPHLSSSAHGNFPAQGSLLSVASTMSSPACWGTGKHFISWVKRAPCEQIGEPTQGHPARAWHRASPRSPARDWLQRSDCLPEPLSLQAVHGSSPTFRGSWCLDGAAEAAPGDITEPHFLSHHQPLSLGSTLQK